MNFKKYLKNIEKKFVEQKPTRKIKPDTKITEEKINHEEKKILGFVDSDKDPYDYLKRYIKETKYKDWFNRNYPNRTIYDAVGLSAADYVKMKRKLVPEPKQTVDTEQSPKLNKPKHKQNINLKSDEEPNNPFNDGLLRMPIEASKSVHSPNHGFPVHRLFRGTKWHRANLMTVSAKHLEVQLVP